MFLGVWSGVFATREALMADVLLTIGIDPGKKGAVVALDHEARPIDWIAADEPGGYCDGDYLPKVLVDWLDELKSREGYAVRLVIIEKQNARPMEGRSSCFTNGKGFGMLIGIIAAAGLPYKIVSPAKWTRDVLGGVKGAERKSKSIAHVQARVPDIKLTWGRRRVPHDGIADATCLSLWGMDK